MANLHILLIEPNSVIRDALAFELESETRAKCFMADSPETAWKVLGLFAPDVILCSEILLYKSKSQYQINLKSGIYDVPTIFYSKTPESEERLRPQKNKEVFAVSDTQTLIRYLMDIRKFNVKKFDQI